ncbi:hypothetical protein [Gimesia sp.]|uniref:hypothetical protein n=1 Tax=Gimesia sp. TaxID=2024833 RepID=UPI0025C73639|nr:hypothetical protein [Gimesia sp.]|tara:strand:- start:1123 stop:2211 length:1089 start_codon:yes stop_codon:yes gene_type:complete
MSQNFLLWLSPLIFVSLFATEVDTCFAAEIEADVISVDSEAGKITVNYKAALGKTTTTLDLSKKATVEVNGQAASLDKLKPGHKVVLDYNEDLAVITEIRASGTPKVPEFVGVQEINGLYGSPTADGKHIVYEVYGVPNSNGAILFTSQRKDSESYFQQHQRLFPGRHPAISGNGLELMFLAKSHPSASEPTLHSTSRESLDQPFRRATEVRELKTFRNPKSPYLTSDGLTLCFRSTGNNAQLVVTTRENRNSPWGSPRPLVAKSVETKLQGFLTWSWLSEDGLILVCSVEGNPKYKKNLLVLKRTDNKTPFVDYKFIDTENVPNQVRCPRYLLGTKELFITGHPKVEPIFQIGVIKNFTLP